MKKNYLKYEMGNLRQPDKWIAVRNNEPKYILLKEHNTAIAFLEIYWEDNEDLNQQLQIDNYAHLVD